MTLPQVKTKTTLYFLSLEIICLGISFVDTLCPLGVLLPHPSQKCFQVHLCYLWSSIRCLFVAQLDPNFQYSSPHFGCIHQLIDLSTVSTLGVFMKTAAIHIYLPGFCVALSFLFSGGYA